MHINQVKEPPGYRLKGRGHIDWQTTQGTKGLYRKQIVLYEPLEIYLDVVSTKQSLKLVVYMC